MMKISNKLLLSIILVAVATGLYRATPLREQGFAPQLAVTIFSGFLFANNKKWAFALPLASMLISDIVYEVLFRMGKAQYGGFYGTSQLINYSFILLTTCFGFFINKISTLKVAAAAFAAPTTYFLLSNTSVFVGGGGWHHPRTFAGFIQTMNDGIPFYKQSLIGTFIFALVLFGGYLLLYKKQTNIQAA
ncbi:MAG: DUF6580 family putative transport protein [Chitinophagaceae bacterium]